jgi:tetratricopeptide (TPR) repeat protein
LRKYLIVVLAVLGIGTAWFIYSSRHIAVSAVPFGLATGTKVHVGEKAKFPSFSVAAEADLRRANDLRMAGAFQAAQDNYETVLLKYPNLPIALFGKAYSIIAEDTVTAEKIAQTKSLIENLAQQMPGSVWVQLLLTFIKEHEGNLNNALDMAAELAAKSPAFSEARLRYADLLLKTEQPAKAAEEARTAISISAGADARAYINLAFALYKMGTLEECSELVNYALPRFPSQIDLLLLQGYLSEYSRDFDKAQSNYKKVLALKPGNINALNAIATLGEKKPPMPGVAATLTGGISLKEQAKETAKILLPLIEEYPENLPLREALGRVYLKARMMKEARQQFSEIHSQDFDYPNIRKLMDESVDELPKFVPQSLQQQQHNKNLADSLAKTYAALRESESFDYDDLGRYLVHYGATFKDFFSKYSVTRFKRLEDENTFIESYRIGSFIYSNTIFFNSKREFYAVRSIVTDTVNANSLDYIHDIFRHFLKKETGILGEGVSVENADCYEDKWNGIIWTSRDNFEVLLQGSKIPRKVFIVRLHAKLFSDTGNICSYVAMALEKSRVPIRVRN